MSVEPIFLPYILDDFDETAPSWSKLKPIIKKFLKEFSQNDFAALSLSIRKIPSKFEPSLSLDAYCSVISDLIDQTWVLETSENGLIFTPPSNASKHVLRKQLLVRRDETLKIKKNSEFIVKFTTPLPGKLSPSCLFHDGEEFQTELKKVISGNLQITDLIKPEIIFFDKNKKEPVTGKRYQDIWRFCRLTWSLEHQSTPGREVPYIIRNSAIKNKPIMGIGCLASPVLQHGLRDDWIGWSVEAANRI